MSYHLIALINLVRKIANNCFSGIFETWVFKGFSVGKEIKMVLFFKKNIKKLC